MVNAQKANDDKLAMQYYEQKQYDKAAVYFDKLYDKLPDAYYTYYFKVWLDCSIFWLTNITARRMDGFADNKTWWGLY